MICKNDVHNNLAENYFSAIKYILGSRQVSVKGKLKFLLRSPRHWKLVAYFLSNLKTLGLVVIVEKCPGLLEKFCRPYLSAKTDACNKLGKLLGHYRLLGQRLSKETISTFFGKGLSLFSLTSQGENLECVIEYDGQYQKEGEICIKLLLGADRRQIYTLVMLFNKHAAFVSCLQGCSGQSVSISQITKMCYGLRPQNLLLFVAQELTRLLSCKAIYGISSDFHVYQLRARTRNRIVFNYDRFWTELGAMPCGAWYALTIEYPRNLAENIPSKKRALYKRRYALMDKLTLDIAATITPRLIS